MKSHEQWAEIPNFSGYFVSNFGRVKVVKMQKTSIRFGVEVVNEKFFTSTRKKGGYFVVRLTSNRQKKSIYIHRLVAEAFVMNRENKPFINHIDGNKLNNHFTNLEWCTQQENTQHSWDNGLQQSCLIWVMEYPNYVEHWYTSLIGASRATGITIKHIKIIDDQCRKNIARLSSRFDFKIFKRGSL